MVIRYISIICGVLLLLGIPTGWPYGYYIILRWVVCIASIYIAYGFYKSVLKGWVWVFGAIAVLFNPIIPFYLSKSFWVLIDFVAAILFFISAYSIKQGK